jgi:hypothetical protein
MKKNKILWFVSLCFVLLFVAPEVSASWEEYEILKYSFDISVTPRQEWYPSISYNPTDNEFLFLWHTSGKLRDDCGTGDDYECTTDFHTIHGQRVLPSGELLGEPFQLSPPETGWKTLPKSAYNVNRNEYMISFSAGGEFLEQKIYIMRIDNEGAINYGPELLPIDQHAVSHPGIRFNSTEQEYLVVLNDTLPTSSEEQAIDNFAVILNADGGLVSGPTVVGSTPGWQFNPQLIYNSVDNTHLVVWEDFRHVEWILDNCDLYGALIDADGNTVGSEFPVIDDFGMEDEGSQQNQYVAYNPDLNEFLVSWGSDEQASLEAWGGIVGRILNGDGTPKGEPFVISDEPKPQHSSQAIYVEKEKKYFVVWADSRNDTEMQPGEPFYMSSQVDIYGKWLEPTGEAAGADIPVCTEEGVQAWPTLAYNPAEDVLLIAWHDLNAPGDYDIIEGGGGGMVFTFPSDVRATLYGVPASTTTTTSVEPSTTTTTTTVQNPCAALKIYGEHSKEVELLRYVRDNILDKTSEGQELIKLYYEWSPAIVKAMEKDGGIKEEVKELINGVLGLVGEEVE